MNTILLVLLLVSILISLFSYIKFAQLKQTKAILKRFDGKKIYGVTSSANFFGQESKGMGQVRGNGVLVLLDGELYYEMLIPKKELRIPFESMIAVETPKFFLSKSKGRSLLKIVFKNEKDESDSAAWLVGNLSHWKSSIEKIIESK